jgi:hypothetical protein
MASVTNARLLENNSAAIAFNWLYCWIALSISGRSYHFRYRSFDYKKINYMNNDFETKIIGIGFIITSTLLIIFKGKIFKLFNKLDNIIPFPVKKGSEVRYFIVVAYFILMGILFLFGFN